MTKSVASSFSPIVVKKSSSFQLKLKSFLKAITLPVLLLIACEYLVRAGFIESYLLPAPTSLWQTFLDLWQADLWMHVWTSTWRVFFDVIVSNPPYIDADDAHMQDLATEPERALVAADHGLADLKVIIQQGKKHLTLDGWVVLEHGYDQGDAVQKIFKEAGYKQVRTVKDYGGNDRVTLGQWTQ